MKLIWGLQSWTPGPVTKTGHPSTLRPIHLSTLWWRRYHSVCGSLRKICAGFTDSLDQQCLISLHVTLEWLTSATSQEPCIYSNPTNVMLNNPHCLCHRPTAWVRLRIWILHHAMRTEFAFLHEFGTLCLSGGVDLRMDTPKTRV